MKVEQIDEMHIACHLYEDDLSRFHLEEKDFYDDISDKGSNFIDFLANVTANKYFKKEYKSTGGLDIQIKIKDKEIIIEIECVSDIDESYTDKYNVCDIDYEEDNEYNSVQENNTPKYIAIYVSKISDIYPIVNILKKGNYNEYNDLYKLKDKFILITNIFKNKNVIGLIDFCENLQVLNMSEFSKITEHAEIITKDPIHKLV